MMNTHSMTTRSKSNKLASINPIPTIPTIPTNPSITNKPDSILSTVQSLRNKLSLLDLKCHQLHQVIPVLSIVIKHQCLDSKYQGLISQTTYTSFMNHLLFTNRKSYTIGQKKQINSLLQSIFKEFSDGDGVPDGAKGQYLDFIDFVCVLSMLTRNGVDQKIKTIFNFLDVEGNGYLTPSRLAIYITAVFKTLFLNSSNCREWTGVSEEVLAETTTNNIFKEMGVVCITFEQFRDWYLEKDPFLNTCPFDPTVKVKHQHHDEEHLLD